MSKSSIEEHILDSKAKIKEEHPMERTEYTSSHGRCSGPTTARWCRCCSVANRLRNVEPLAFQALHCIEADILHAVNSICTSVLSFDQTPASPAICTEAAPFPCTAAARGFWGCRDQGVTDEIVTLLITWPFWTHYGFNSSGFCLPPVPRPHHVLAAYQPRCVRACQCSLCEVLM